MPKSVLTRKRSLIARFAVLAMVFSLMAVALPASAHSVALDTTGPCPATTPSAGFTDIGALDTTTQTAINCLFAFGITTGTSATTYSPNDTITRWQMALFLIRQAADHGITIPAATSQGYTDIGAFDTATQNAINQITQLGISKGTSSTTFSPNAGVTRWQMALFIHRTGIAAGVTFLNNVAHNVFTDILTQSEEAQTSINALADTRADPEGHIALGTGLSLFSPDLILVRWQMALFLTRLLAADNVAAPSGTAVVVTPTAQATQTSGTARTYSATLKNADGTNYTGQAIIRLRDANSDGTVGTTAATGVDIEAVDGAALAGTQVTTTVLVGIDGALTFTVRHTPATAAADFVPQVIRDANTNGTVDSGEAIGSGGATFFTFTPAELAAGAGGTFLVCSTDKADDFFVVDTSVDNDCDSGAGVAFTPARVEYDDNDIYQGAATNMPDFETALSAGDTVAASPYASSDAGESTFVLTNVVSVLAVDAPTTPVDAATATVSGTGNPGWEVVVYRDTTNNDTYETATDVPVTVATAIGADGDWSVSVPLFQDAVNHFIAVQRSAGSSISGAPADAARDVEPVPPITETPAVGTNFTSTDLTTSAGVADTLDPGDVITIVFSGDVTGVGSGDTYSLLDTDGTTATIICGTHAACAEPAAGTVTITMNAVLPTTGGTTGGINNAATITAVSGFTAADGTAIALSGDRTFTMP